MFNSLKSEFFFWFYFKLFIIDANCFKLMLIQQMQHQNYFKTTKIFQK